MVRKHLDPNAFEDFANLLARETELARSAAVGRMLRESGSLDLLAAFSILLRQSSDAEVAVVAADFARKLWSRSVAAGQGDLPLYWTRLRMMDALIDSTRSRGAPTPEAAAALRGFDSLSRNLGAAPDQCAEEETGEAELWITGFDPYGLDPARPLTFANTNPSGAAALALHDRRLTGASGKAYRVRAAIFPVRFQDFSEGRVESFLSERVFVSRDCAFVFTISMGGSPDAFHIDRFPGNCRGAQPDNAGRVAGPARILSGRGPAFVEHRLSPAQLNALRTVSAERMHFPVRDCRDVETREGGVFAAGSLADLKAATAVRGAGGDYLSNEITFRVLSRLARAGRRAIVSAHIHTPRLREGQEVSTIAKRERIVAQIQAMLVAVA